MSGIFRRGTFTFVLDQGSHPFGSDPKKKPPCPEVNVISIDIHKNCEDVFNYEKEEKSQVHEDISKDIDSDIISNYMGHFGLWQLIWTALLSLFGVPTTFHIFAFVFQTMQKDFWCARPEEFANMTVANWRQFSQPEGPCLIYEGLQAINGKELQLPISGNLTKCLAFEFSQDHMGTTIIEEYGLVCDRGNFLSVVEMCFLAGAAVGSVSSGYVSDRYGRKHTLMASAFVQTVLGTLLAFSPSLTVFMVLRVIVGFASMTVAVVSFVLVVELVSGKWRTIVGILGILPVAIAYILTSFIAYLTPDWRIMQLVISVPWVALLFIWYCVPESPRWLLARGRIDELVELIERAARMNGRTLPSAYRKTLEDVLEDTVSPPISPSPRPLSTILNENGPDHPVNGSTTSAMVSDSPLVVVFNKQYIRTTVLTLIVWLTMIIVYFGLTLHISNLGGNIYLSTIIAGVVESISICLSIFVVLRFGIRKNLVAYMFTSGVCCLATNLVPDGNIIGIIALAIIAKCVIGANNAIIPTYTAQQYPTVVRNFGLGMGNLAAGVGLIIVPYMWLLEHTAALLPMTVMGVCGITGAGALLLMKDNPVE